METLISNYVAGQFGIAGLVLLAIGIGVFRLSSDLAKVRTDLQLQAARDLLNRRFNAYSELWSRLRPIAIYSADPLTSQRIGDLSRRLSDWYFSTEGGMFLTSRTRDFYFALQDVLRGVKRLKHWYCEQRPTQPEQVFEDLLKTSGTSQFTVDDLKHPELLDGALWRNVCRAVVETLRLMQQERPEALSDSIFSAVQQVSSVLRSNLAHELNSRLEVKIPRL